MNTLIYRIRQASSATYLGGLAFVLLAVTAGCATTSFRTPPPQYQGKSPVTAIYVYSFLDYREGKFGPKFLAEVQRRLPEAIAAHGVKTKVLSFGDSAMRAKFSITGKPVGPGGSVDRIPLEEVIAENRPDEEMLGPSHRLVVVPSYTIYSNYGSNFDVRWDMFDAKTNERVWTATSQSHHMKWLLPDENPGERAESFVEGVIAEMEKASVLARRHP